MKISSFANVFIWALRRSIYFKVLDFSKEILLWCASPSAVLLKEDKIIFAKYFLDQHHENLFDYLHFKLDDLKEPNLVVQVRRLKFCSYKNTEMHCQSIYTYKNYFIVSRFCLPSGHPLFIFFPYNSCTLIVIDFFAWFDMVVLVIRLPKLYSNNYLI